MADADGSGLEAAACAADGRTREPAYLCGCEGDVCVLSPGKYIAPYVHHGAAAGPVAVPTADSVQATESQCVPAPVLTSGSERACKQRLLKPGAAVIVDNGDTRTATQQDRGREAPPATGSGLSPCSQRGPRGMGPSSGPGRRFAPADTTIAEDAGEGDEAPSPSLAGTQDSEGLVGAFAAPASEALGHHDRGGRGAAAPVQLTRSSSSGAGCGIVTSGVGLEQEREEPGAGSSMAQSGPLGAQWLGGQASLPNTKSGDSGLVGGAFSDGSHGSWVDTMTMWSAVQRNGQEMQRRRLVSPPPDSCAGAALGTAPRRFVQRVRTQLVVMARVIIKDPATLVVPAFLLVCLLAFGLWGVFSVSYAIRDGRRQAALNAATDFSNTLKSHIAATVAPASTVKTLIELDPEWESINDTFHQVAPSLVQKGRETDAILTIVMAPQGIVRAIVPTGLPGWEKVYGLDLLRNLSWRNDALKTVQLHEQGMVMTGPSRLRAGMMGIVTRYAVFIDGGGPNETWGAPGLAYNCSPCYVPPTPTSASQRFWGFAQLNVDWEVLIRNTTHMYDLCERDSLNFNMTYIDPVTQVNRSIASCGQLGPMPVFVNISVMQNHWILAVSDARGWTPDWTPWVVAVVVLVSLWVAGAMAVIMINRREHMWLLQAMLPKKVIAALRRGEDYAEAFECVTVLFSDIVSYTTIASAMEPIKVVRLLNEMYSAFDALVDQYECYKVETIGDAFMAVSGTQGEDPVAAAVKMARLATAMIECTRVLVSADGQKIQIRIGLHSGPVVGAVVGFKMPHFCLCGDTVNTASRMESNSRPMRIHISDVTAQLLLRDPSAGFRVETRGPIEVKGKGQMLTHWLLPPPPQQEDRGDAGGAASGASPGVSSSGVVLRKSTSGVRAGAAAAPADGTATTAATHVHGTRSADGMLHGTSQRRRRNHSGGDGGGGGSAHGASRAFHYLLSRYSVKEASASASGTAVVSTAASSSGVAPAGVRGVGAISGSSRGRRSSVDLRLFQHGSQLRAKPNM